VVESSSSLLSELVVAAVRSWKFKPATKGGVPQIIWVQQSFAMRL
jgi:outer membrane biosynthesis protein TonB